MNCQVCWFPRPLLPRQFTVDMNCDNDDDMQKPFSVTMPGEVEKESHLQLLLKQKHNYFGGILLFY